MQVLQQPHLKVEIAGGFTNLYGEQRFIFALEVISKVRQKWQKFLVAICKWSVFGGYPAGSHAQTTIPNSSTIFFQPNFAGLLKLPRILKN